MKTIATWSNRNVNAARLLIAVSHITIAVLGCFVGVSLNLNQFLIPVQFLWLSIVLFFAIILISHQLGYKGLSFNHRKMLDMSIGLCSFAIIIISSNQRGSNHFVFFDQLHGALPEKSEIAKKPSVRELKKQWKELKTMAKKDKASAGRIILAIIVAWLLVGLVAALSCSLACSGQGALAAIMLIGGLVGVFYVIRAILRSGRRSNTKPSVQPSS